LVEPRVIDAQPAMTGIAARVSRARRKERDFMGRYRWLEN
jgi:hypothetical protein